MRILPVTLKYQNYHNVKETNAFGKHKKESSNKPASPVLDIFVSNAQSDMLSTEIISKKPLVIYYENSDQVKEKEFFDGSLEEYSQNGTLIRRVFDDGCEQRFYKKKCLSFESFENGTWKSYYPDGTMYAQQLKDKTYIKYTPDGDVEYVCYPDNSEFEYLYDEGLIFESNSRICTYSYASNHKIAAEILKNGEKRIYRENGSLKYEILPNGLQYKYTRAGIPQLVSGLELKDTIELIKD